MKETKLLIHSLIVNSRLTDLLAVGSPDTVLFISLHPTHLNFRIAEWIKEVEWNI